MRAVRTLHLSGDTLEEIGRLLVQGLYDETHAWLDTSSGQLVLATSLYGLDKEDDEKDDVFGDRPQWMEDERRQVAAILADETGRYVEVPVGQDAGTFGKLGDFARTLTDPELHRGVRDRMRGRGAFRRVKDYLHGRGKIDLWRTFEDAYNTRRAVDWLQSRHVVVAGYEE